MARLKRAAGDDKADVKDEEDDEDDDEELDDEDDEPDDDDDDDDEELDDEELNDTADPFIASSYGNKNRFKSSCAC